MRIYSLKCDPDKYEWLLPVDVSIALDITRSFNGERFFGASWSPLEVYVYEDNRKGKGKSCDFPVFKKHIPVFSKNAVEKLEDILVENGEILPLKCGDGDYYAYNVTRIANILDVRNSDIVRFKSSGRIMLIDSYSFKNEVLSELAIFKVPEASTMDVFFTDIFVERVQEADLTGFEFELVWDSSLATT